MNQDNQDNARPVTKDTLSLHAIIPQKIIEEIEAERDRQDKQWGGPAHDDQHTPFDWMTYIVSQIEKLGYNVLERGENYFETPDCRDRLVKVAALAVASLQSYDRIKASGSSFEEEFIRRAQQKSKAIQDGMASARTRH